MLDAVDGGGGVAPTPDLSKTTQSGNNAASLQSQDSFTVTIDNLPVQLFAKYGFTFSYLYQNGSSTIEGPRSATYFLSYSPPNECTEPSNITLTQGIGSYGIKWDKPSFGTYVDTIIYESSTNTFDNNSKVVYIGTANQTTVLTGTDYSNRYIKIYFRDKYLHKSPTGTVAGPISGKNSDPDTSTPPTSPSGVTVVGSIDNDDKTGFSGKITASWTANNDSNTSGYVIRWSTQNPVTTQNPIWEYGQVEGKATTTFTVTGLLPNTLYYYQVTAKSPYNAISWLSPQSGTFGPIVDANAPSDAWAQLRSILSIGGKTADLFKIGTGIAQQINTSTTTTPNLVNGTYGGVILNKSTTNFGHNYWLNTGQFRVGSSSAFLYWDGSDLYTTGKITATGGSFSGDIQLSTGSLYTGSTPNSGARVRFNNAGIFGYDSSSTNTSTGQTFALDAATGLISAQKGSISGWSIDGTKLSQNGAIISSTGYMSLGSASADQIVLSAVDSTYRLWIGNNNGTYGSFSVDKNGILRAQGAIISGPIVITSGTTYDSIASAINKSNDAYSVAYQASGKAQNAYDLANGKIAATDVQNAIANNVTIIDGAKITTGQIDLARLNITAGSAGNFFTVDASGIRAYKNYSETVNISSSGTASFSGKITATEGSIGNWTINTNGTITNGTTLFFGSGTNTAGGNVDWAIFDITKWGYLSGLMTGSGGIQSTSGTIITLTGDVIAAGGALVAGISRSILYSDGSIYANTLGVYTGASAYAIRQVYAGGSGTNASGFLRVNTSSRKFKKDIVPLEEGNYTNLLTQLTPVSYLDRNENDGDPKAYGLIAEEVAEIAELKDGLVPKDADGNPGAVHYELIGVLSIMALKEIKKKIESIETRLDAINA